MNISLYASNVLWIGTHGYRRDCEVTFGEDGVEERRTLDSHDGIHYRKTKRIPHDDGLMQCTLFLYKRSLLPAGLRIREGTEEGRKRGTSKVRCTEIKYRF